MEQPLARLFSLRHEFPSEWRRFLSTAASAANSLTVDLATTRFPYFSQGRTITIQRASAIVVSTAAVAPRVAIAPGAEPPASSENTWEGEASPGAWTLATGSNPTSLSDVFVILEYSLT
jgi:hypothetical protein